MKEIQEIIAEYQAKVHDIPVPTSYRQLRLATIAYELKTEIKELQILLNEYNQSEENFKLAFKRHCAYREQQNADTLLNYPAGLESHCNMMYWKIAYKLFQPETIQEMLSILLPGVTHSLRLEYSFGDTRLKDDLVIHCQKIPCNTTDFSKEDIASPCPLKNFIIAGELIFDAREIAEFSFPLHLKFYRSIRDNYPLLCKKLYQHSKHLKSLFDHIDLIDKSGETPKEKIIKLIAILSQSGLKFTGLVLAPHAAFRAIQSFVDYMKNLPVELRNNLINLKNLENKSISAVIGDLARGNCVEIAASDLLGILKNSSNDAILNCRPGLSEQEVSRIYGYYKNPKGFSVSGNDKTENIPDSMAQAVLKNLVINNLDNLINLLIVLPASKYDIFFQYAKITINLDQLNALVQNMPQLYPEQLKAFFVCLIKFSDKFGGLSNSLYFIESHNGPHQAQIFPEVFQHISAKNRQAVLQLKLESYQNLPDPVLELIDMIKYSDATGRKKAVEILPHLLDKDEKRIDFAFAFIQALQKNPHEMETYVDYSACDYDYHYPLDQYTHPNLIPFFLDWAKDTTKKAFCYFALFRLKNLLILNKIEMGKSAIISIFISAAQNQDKDIRYLGLRILYDIALLKNNALSYIAKANEVISVIVNSILTRDPAEDYDDGPLINVHNSSINPVIAEIILSKIKDTDNSISANAMGFLEYTINNKSKTPELVRQLETLLEDPDKTMKIPFFAARILIQMEVFSHRALYVYFYGLIYYFQEFDAEVIDDILNCRHQEKLPDECISLIQNGLILENSAVQKISQQLAIDYPLPAKDAEEEKDIGEEEKGMEIIRPLSPLRLTPALDGSSRLAAIKMLIEEESLPDDTTVPALMRIMQNDQYNDIRFMAAKALVKLNVTDLLVIDYIACGIFNEIEKGNRYDNQRILGNLELLHVQHIREIFWIINKEKYLYGDPPREADSGNKSVLGNPILCQAFKIVLNSLKSQFLREKGYQFINQRQENANTDFVSALIMLLEHKISDCNTRKILVDILCYKIENLNMVAIHPKLILSLMAAIKEDDEITSIPAGKLLQKLGKIHEEKKLAPLSELEKNLFDSLLIENTAKDLLFEAIHLQHPGLIQYLLDKTDKNFSIMKKNIVGNNALMQSVLVGNPGIIKLLLGRMSLKEIDDENNPFSQTALAMAKSLGKEDIANAIVEARENLQLEIDQTMGNKRKIDDADLMNSNRNIFFIEQNNKKQKISAETNTDTNDTIIKEEKKDNSMQGDQY